MPSSSHETPIATLAECPPGPPTAYAAHALGSMQELAGFAVDQFAPSAATCQVWSWAAGADAVRQPRGSRSLDNSGTSSWPPQTAASVQRSWRGCRHGRCESCCSVRCCSRNCGLLRLAAARMAVEGGALPFDSSTGRAACAAFKVPLLADRQWVRRPGSTRLFPPSLQQELAGTGRGGLGRPGAGGATGIWGFCCTVGE